MKILIQCFFLLFQLFGNTFSNNVSNQNKDVFPLKLNCSWIYTIQSGSKGCQSFAQDCSGYDDSGSVSYSIIDSSTHGDSISWVVKVTRVLQVHEYDQTKNYDSTYNVNDSTTFILYEKLTSNHQLITETISKDINPVWTFKRDYNINRFQETDSTGNALLSFFISGIPSVNTILKFHADTGLVDSKTSGASILFSRYLNATLSKSILTEIKRLTQLEKTPISLTFENIYPNPFNSSSMISFSIPNATEVNIYAYNILGERVEEITKRYYSSGTHNLSWSPNNLSSGIYFIKMSTKNYTVIKRCLLLK